MKIKQSLIIVLLYISGTSFAEQSLIDEIIRKTESKVLLIDPWKSTVPAGTTTFFAQAKAFADNGSFITTMVWEKSYSEQLHKQFNLLYTTMPLATYNSVYAALKAELPQLIAKYGIDTVITPRWQDIRILKKLATVTPFKIIFLRIGTLEEDELVNNMALLQDIEGFVSTTKIAEYVRQINIEKNLNIKKIASIHPFWNESRCANFTPQETRQEYFARRFNIQVLEYPVVCTVANMENPCKNYPLLIAAIAKIVHEKKRIVHAMLAGHGALKESLEALAKELNIQEYVHFLGSVDDVPALLYHSDMHILPSYYENFPLANFEAAYMKKPCIITGGLDASIFVKNQETGLLFENRNLDDLILKIEELIDNPEKAKLFGINNFQHLQNEYSNQALYNKWKQFLDQK